LNLILLQAGARMASVLYAILDPEEGVVRFASAGHPPMMLVEPTGEVSYLRSGRSPLLGHPHTSERPQAVASLEAGSTLLLYTDGVLEDGCKSVDEALDRLARRGAEAATLTLEEMCAQVLPELPPGEHQLDDAALLACRLVPMDEPSLQVQLDADPAQLRVLRRTLGRWLDTFEPGRDERFQLLLATDEAARNAVEHAYGLEAGSFAVDATHDGGLITIRVTDAGRWRSPGGRRKGRGIALMRKLVDEMDIRDLNPGTEVVLMRRLRHE
jgi:anti-sigma regulatory factor (Ser/Thr protein kinase)